MKKGLAILLLITHLISVTGVFASIHFCGDKITQLTFAGMGHQEDCSCAQISKTDCCSDVKVESRLSPLAVAVPINKITKPTLIALTSVCFPSGKGIFSGVETSGYRNSGPPLTVRQKLRDLMMLRI